MRMLPMHTCRKPYPFPIIAGALMAAFGGAGWHLALERVPPSPDMAASPLQPLLAVAVRKPQTLEGCRPDAPDAPAASAAAQAVELRFAAAAVAGPAAAQLAAIERVPYAQPSPMHAPCFHMLGSNLL